MSKTIIAEVRRHSQVRGLGYFLLIELAHQANHEGIATIALRYLAIKLHVHVRTVCRWIKRLENAGYIRVRRRPITAHPHEMNTYQIVRFWVEDSIAFPSEARLNVLRSMRRVAYVNTPEWATKRAQVLELAGHACHVCSRREALDVHHRTYKRLGHESLDDLIVLCSGCHYIFHQNGRLARHPEEEGSVSTFQNP